MYKTRLERSLCSDIHFVGASEKSEKHKDGDVHSLQNVPLSIGDLELTEGERFDVLRTAVKCSFYY